MITITTVLKTGSYYDYTWVDKMKRSLDRHMSIPFRFCPLTDYNHEYENYNLEYENTGYWNKIELFKPRLYSGPTLYLDLDNVIIGDLAPMIKSFKGYNFIMNKNNPTKHSIDPLPSSCVMYWETDVSYLWDTWNSKSPNFWYKKYSGGRLGDQAFIREHVKKPLSIVQNVYTDARKKFIYAKGTQTAKIEESILVIFSANKKPHTSKWEIIKKEWQD